MRCVLYALQPRKQNLVLTPKIISTKIITTKIITTKIITAKIITKKCGKFEIKLCTLVKAPNPN